MVCAWACFESSILRCIFVEIHSSNYCCLQFKYSAITQMNLIRAANSISILHKFVRLEDTSKYSLRNLCLSKKTHMAHCKNIRMTKFTFFIAWRLTNFFQILRKFWRKFIEPRNLSEALGVLNCYSCLRSGCVESRIQMYFSCLASHMSDCVPSRLKMSLFYVFLHLVSN